MIVLAKENPDSNYVYAYLDNGKELKQPGKLHGYTDSSFAVEQNNVIRVFNERNEEIYKYPPNNPHAKDDLEAILAVNE